ncbi:acyl-CoA thioesterase [Lacinutrix mariniflava]|uniref:acyl-CoA thioesterase n=1 Tax=Lacinutrix mariniflava TaxID=342955 RepID=UPI0006E2F63B|nr:acyl-CoA thioesterase [Lacinutrix mariniflava]
MQVFTQTLTVTEKDLDELNHVNNVRYIDWVNSVAKSHWLKNGPKNITENFFWILLSHTIDYKKPAFLNDEILLKTYVINAKGVTCNRIVEIFNTKTNTLLAKSETKWCFMSSKTLKPARITEEVSKLFF